MWWVVPATCAKSPISILLADILSLCCQASAPFRDRVSPVFVLEFGAPERMARGLQSARHLGELLGTWSQCAENTLSVKTSVKIEL